VFERSGKEGHERISLLAALRFEVALHDRRRQRLDQQTSFAAATVPAEAHDNCACRAFRRHPPRQRRVARRQTRSMARLLCQAFALLPGKRLRNPMGPARRLDRRVPAPADGFRFRSTHPVPFRALGAGQFELKRLLFRESLHIANNRD
jgi:hypothetical protein